MTRPFIEPAEAGDQPATMSTCWPRSAYFRRDDQLVGRATTEPMSLTIGMCCGMTPKCIAHPAKRALVVR